MGQIMQGLVGLEGPFTFVLTEQGSHCRVLRREMTSGLFKRISWA